MTKEEKENVLHCLKSINDEEVCEECNLYGTTGTDHCQYDMVKLAIEALSEPTKTEPTTITENMTNGDVLNKIFPVIAERARDNEYYLDKDKDNLTYIHIDGDWISKPYKGNFTTPTRPKAKWIRVDERLPEEGGDYLVTESFDLFVKEPTIEVHKNFYCILSKKWLYDNDNVVAWMPLPEPYNAEMESDSDA